MEERLAGSKVYDGKLFQVYRERVRLPNGRDTTREIVRHPGSVGIVPRDARGNVVLVRQFRYATSRELWEIPAGTRDRPGEEVEATARRELREEAGLIAERWVRLGRVFLYPGYGDETMTFFLAEGLSATQPAAEPDESFTVTPFTLHDLRVLRATGEIQDAKTLLGLAWAGLDVFAEA